MYSSNSNSILLPENAVCLFLGSDEINTGTLSSLAPPDSGTTCAQDENNRMIQEKKIK